jgi:hypothetical protein
MVSELNRQKPRISNNWLSWESESVYAQKTSNKISKTWRLPSNQLLLSLLSRNFGLLQNFSFPNTAWDIYPWLSTSNRTSNLHKISPHTYLGSVDHRNLHIILEPGEVQSVERLATAWKIRGLNDGKMQEIFTFSETAKFRSGPHPASLLWDPE